MQYGYEVTWDRDSAECQSHPRWEKAGVYLNFEEVWNPTSPLI